MFCFESVVRYSEVDADGFMKLPSILDLMQDCCIFQSEELGIGLDFCAAPTECGRFLPGRLSSGVIPIWGNG